MFRVFPIQYATSSVFGQLVLLLALLWMWLIGTTLDVDLVTLWSRGIVRILVAMPSSAPLDKQLDPTGPYIGTA